MNVVFCTGDINPLNADFSGRRFMIKGPAPSTDELRAIIVSPVPHVEEKRSEFVQSAVNNGAGIDASSMVAIQVMGPSGDLATTGPKERETALENEHETY